MDCKIIFNTFKKVINRSDIAVGNEFVGGKFIEIREQRNKDIMLVEK